MTGLTTLVAWRSALDYVRRPLNVVLLVVVPIVIVVVWGGALADFSKVILGGTGDRAQIEVAAAGWATAALAGLAGFFQVSGSGAVDRRLAAASGSSEQAALTLTILAYARTRLAPVPTSTNLAVAAGTSGSNSVPRLRTLLGLVTAAQYGLAIFEGTFVLYARDRLSLSAGQTSVAFVVCGLVMALQVPASALMTKVAGPLSQVAIGFALMGIGISALLTTTSYPVVLAMVAVLAAGAALVIPNLSALVTIGQRTSTSVALGWKSSASSLGQFLGPVVGGSLIVRHADLPFLMAGMLLTGVGVGIAIACRRSKSQLGHGVRPHVGKPTALTVVATDAQPPRP